MGLMLGELEVVENLVAMGEEQVIYVASGEF